MDDRLKIIETVETAEDEYWNSMADTVSALDIDDQTAVVFIHGYNVSFDEAAIRAAQIGFDLSIKGIMAFYSWPSLGGIFEYLADSASIEASEEHLTKFLLDIASKSGARTIHVIAHSMGNRGFLRAANRIAASFERAAKVPFSQIILAAPDVDTDTFRGLCAAYRQIANRATLYVSCKDAAIEMSGNLHAYPRAGFTPPICVSLVASTP